jgi:hypothetical protein
MGSLQANQIVCLTQADLALYGEVIQVISDRQLCWVRPIAIAHYEAGAIVQLHNLQEGSDLVLPIILFREALDTELLPILSQLYSSDEKSESTIDPTARQILHQLIRAICQANPDLFAEAREPQ